MKTPPIIGTEELLSAADWLVGEDVGGSSKYLLATALAGRPPTYTRFNKCPQDAHDLDKCMALTLEAPWVQEIAFPVLRGAHPEWQKLIDHWSELERLCQEALMNRSDTICRRMNEILGR